MISRVLALLATVLLASPAFAQTLTLPWANVLGGTTPGLQNQPLFLYFAPPAFDPNTTIRIDRHIDKGSGVAGNTYSALWGMCSTNPANLGYEWCGKFELHNNAAASTGAQNVALNATIFKEGKAPVGPTWALNGNCVDLTGESDPVASCLGLELDVSTTVASTDKHRQRVALQISGGGVPGAHIGYGVMMGATQGATIDRGLAFLGGGGLFGIGLDTTQASFSGAAIAMGPRQWLAFDADANGKFGRFLGFDSSDGLFKYMTPSGPMMTFSDDGAAKVGRLIQALPHVPASRNAPCQTGEQAYDASFFYVCIAPNRWRRAALTDW